MEKDNTKDNIDNAMIELLSDYSLLKSSMEIFCDAVDYDTELDNKYNDMVKIINMLVLTMENSMKQLNEQLDLLLNSEEV